MAYREVAMWEILAVLERISRADCRRSSLVSRGGLSGSLHQADPLGSNRGPSAPKADALPIGVSGLRHTPPSIDQR